jgi:hypothetical protein
LGNFTDFRSKTNFLKNGIWWRGEYDGESQHRTLAATGSSGINYSIRNS